MEFTKPIVAGPPVDKNEYHDLFFRSVKHGIHPSRWHLMVPLGWISVQDWFDMCKDKDYWLPAYHAVFPKEVDLTGVAQAFGGEVMD